MPTLDLSFRFEDNGSLHKDLILQFGTERFICDSYYLALDSGVLPGREDSEKVRAVFSRLLKQWLAALDTLADGGTAYLPFDFSDECSRWLSCSRSGDEATVSVGWATVEGWALRPSALDDLTRSPQAFQTELSPIRGSVSALTAAIRESLSQVAR